MFSLSCGYVFGEDEFGFSVFGFWRLFLFRFYLYLFRVICLVSLGYILGIVYMGYYVIGISWSRMFFWSGDGIFFLIRVEGKVGRTGEKM